MFNVILQLHIVEKDGKKYLAGKWLNKGEVHDFGIQCEAQDVFETLQKMKDKNDKSIKS